MHLALACKGTMTYFVQLTGPTPNARRARPKCRASLRATLSLTYLLKGAWTATAANKTYGPTYGWHLITPLCSTAGEPCVSPSSHMQRIDRSKVMHISSRKLLEASCPGMSRTPASHLRFDMLHETDIHRLTFPAGCRARLLDTCCYAQLGLELI